MRVHVSFTPADELSAPVAIAVDVLRATSTICAAVAAGYEEVVCVGSIEDARALAGPDVALAGERACVRIEGFDFGNSPRELAAGPAAARTLALTTTNGTRLLLAAAARCGTVLVGSLANLGAVVRAARAAAALGGEPTDSAVAAIAIARGFPSALEALAASTSAENLRRVGLDDDVAWCAREDVLDVVPRVVARNERSVRVALADG